MSKQDHSRIGRALVGIAAGPEPPRISDRIRPQTREHWELVLDAIDKIQRLVRSGDWDGLRRMIGKSPSDCEPRVYTVLSNTDLGGPMPACDMCQRPFEEHGPDYLCPAQGKGDGQ